MIKQISYLVYENKNHWSVYRQVLSYEFAANIKAIPRAEFTVFVSFNGGSP